MSNYLYLTCESHDPVLYSADEVSQHPHREIERVRQWVADREALGRIFSETCDLGEYFANNAMRFLRDHTNCRLGAIDEYGEQWSLTLGDPAKPTTPSTADKNTKDER